MKRFEDLDAWKTGMEVAEAVYQLTSGGAFDRDWGLRDQLRRSAVSIPANIAEGFERNSDGDYNRFVLIAK